MHTCQGLNAGPSKPGQSPNAVQSIIFDPGERSFEASCLGTFYTGISRATTLGKGNPKDSALLFIHNNVTPHRLTRMTYTTNKNTKLIHVRRRDAWIELLNTNTWEPKYTKEEINDVFNWSRKNQISKHEVQHFISTNSIHFINQLETVLANTNVFIQTHKYK